MDGCRGKGEYRLSVQGVYRDLSAMDVLHVLFDSGG